jgi:hypothetical protein
MTKHFSHLTKEFLYEEYIVKHKSTGKIGKEIGTSANTIGHHLKKHGIPLRESYMTGRDLSGKKHYKLLYLKPLLDLERGQKGELKWLCQCDCGEEHIVKSSDFKKVRSCGCERGNGKTHYKWSGHEELSGQYWSRMCNGAARRGLEVKIDIKYCWDLFIKQDRKCALSGVDLEIKIKNMTASLDRIDSKVGYIEGNLQWIHKVVQRMKWNLSDEEFTKWCSLISNNIQKD